MAIHSLTHSLTHLRTHPLTHSLTHTLTLTLTLSETSGCAGVAAAMAGKLGAAKRVVCVVSGRNISMQDMQHEMGEGSHESPNEDTNAEPRFSKHRATLASILCFCLGFGLRHVIGDRK